MGLELPKGSPVRSYITSFASDEVPLSEGGLWVQGRRDGIDWCDVVSTQGRAIGELTRMNVAEKRAEQGNLDEGAEGSAPIGDYDDPTAVLGGRWGRTQFVKAHVFSRNPTEQYFQEVELRVRTTIRPNSITGYEVFFRCLKNEAAYAEIVRWDGAIGRWHSLTRRVGPDCGVKDGDVIEASIVGNVIKGYINGAEITSAVDDTYPEGSPGVGFNFGVGDTNVDTGLTYFETHTYE
jgi:hypothetical protein